MIIADLPIAMRITEITVIIVFSLCFLWMSVQDLRGNRTAMAWTQSALTTVTLLLYIGLDAHNSHQSWNDIDPDVTHNMIASFALASSALFGICAVVLLGNLLLFT